MKYGSLEHKIKQRHNKGKDNEKLNTKIESQNFYSLVEIHICQHTNVVHVTKYTMYAGKLKIISEIRR